MMSLVKVLNYLLPDENTNSLKMSSCPSQRLHFFGILLSHLMVLI